MRSIVFLCVLGVTLVQGQGGGFLDGITNTFNNLFGSGQRPQRGPRPQRPERRPQFQQQQQQQQQQFQSQQQFQPQQQFQQQPQQQQFEPQQQQQQFQPQRQQQFQPPAQPPPPAPTAPRFRAQAAPASSSSSSSNRLVGGTSKCGAASPNHFWTDPRDNIRRGYIATWKIGCSTFEQHEAKEYCNSMAMEPVSLDSPAKQDNFNRLIAQDAQRYFWTGGVVDHRNEVVTWNNVNAAPVGFKESAHWSPTGGADLPQPDNRAATENPPHPEVCLGILNNFYADGIKWHDVACHHKKPTICEPRS